MDYVIVSFSFMHENPTTYLPEEIIDTYKGLNSYKDSHITYHSLLIVLRGGPVRVIFHWPSVTVQEETGVYCDNFRAFFLIS
jgi:hypothetical protein